MNCKQVTERFPEYLQGVLDPAESAEIAAHLDECETCARDLGGIAVAWDRLGQLPDEEPRPALRERFLDALAHEQDIMCETAVPAKPARFRGIVIPLETWLPRVAAAVLLIAGGFLAGRLTEPPAEIAGIQEEMAELKSLVAASIVNQQSALQRIEGLSLAGGVQDPDEQFLSLLLMTLNTDPNVNVRLAAVNALERFQQNRWVRSELVNSLSRESSPVVQISLIELLVDMREQNALSVLRAISENDQTLDAVRNRARWGIQQLI